MPTFDDQLADAAEASAALLGLAHATRAMPEPAASYAVIGDLLAGMRSLRQVLDQLAAAHIGHRASAHSEAGDQAAGAASALAAADELHQAGSLLDTVEWRLHAASQYSGRISWHTVAEAGGPDAVRTTVLAGALTLTVWPDTPLGEHQRYAYRVEDQVSGESIDGRDLFTGAGTPVSPGRALRDLAGYLAAAGEARRYALENPGADAESEGLFPAWMADAALRNDTALTLLAEAGQQPPQRPRWISVVFLQGDKADMVLDLIERDGTDAAIEYLSGYDYGEDTVQDALANGYVYDAPPTGALDREAHRDVYTLTYNHSLGHVGLLREYDTAPDPALLSIGENEAGPSRQRSQPEICKPVARDWFAHHPGTAPEQSRRLSL
ncbi:Putative uncharacterized protein [Propionibacterium freudenreichii]|uniref:hypothetical protein n=1 Tax=Propionibacterium freudenreichii TaxID=1744 RepID=UPI0005A5C6DD|nr:hypothetical protein [Propionibacterium freudenreichii]CEI28269.1 Putative uncharacterized protein [Propionibacterium freudenreichii]SBN96594.1 Hypothetical protein PFR_JS12-2_2210 [Propionibacterium freudenreichii]SCC98179.1 Hypothetical protein PFR_JS12-1_2211 [Propionibacterium freudenreichii]